MSWSEPILHVDMDSFFVEVERLDAPELRGRPVAVGGRGKRGVIASASYEARSFGVRSAQPTSNAIRLCPQLVVVPPSHDKYREASVGVFTIFRSFTPKVEGLSLDEAFLDVRGLRRHYNSPLDVAGEIRSRLRQELGLPASVGIGAVKFIAKLASEAAKPDGVRHVPGDEQQSFLSSLPARAMWGVGPAAMAALSRLGVETIGDIASLPEAALVSAVGPTAGRHLHDLSRGVDPRPVVADNEAKSVSVEETYEEDLDSREVVETALLGQSQRLSGRLRRSGLIARTISLKIRFGDFETITRSRTLDEGTDEARRIFHTTRDLLGSVEDLRPVRLSGIAASGLSPDQAPRQMAMDSDSAWSTVEDAVAEVRDRFGQSAVMPARLASDRQSSDPDEVP